MSGRDVAFEISGNITDTDVLAELARVAEEDGASFDWLFDSNSKEIAENIIDAARSGKRLCLVKRDTTDPFELVAEFCRKNGLSFRRSFSYPGQDGYFSADIWSAKYGKLLSFNLDDKERPLVPMKDLTKAVEKGADAVAALVVHINNAFSAVETSRIEVSEEVISAWSATSQTKVSSPLRM